MPTAITLQVGGQQYASTNFYEFPPLHSLHGLQFNHDRRAYQLRVIDADELRFEATWRPGISEKWERVVELVRNFRRTLSAIFSGRERPPFPDPCRPFLDSCIGSDLHNWAVASRIVTTFDEQAERIASQLLPPSACSGTAETSQEQDIIVPEQDIIGDRHGSPVIRYGVDGPQVDEAALRNWLEDRVLEDPTNRFMALQRRQHVVVTARYKEASSIRPHARIKAALAEVVQAKVPHNGLNFTDWVRSFTLVGEAFTDQRIAELQTFLHTTDLVIEEDASDERRSQVQGNITRFKEQFLDLFPDMMRLHRAIDSRRLTYRLRERSECTRPGARMMDMAQQLLEQPTPGGRFTGEGRLEGMNDSERRQLEAIANSDRPEDIYTLALVTTARECFWRINDLMRQARSHRAGQDGAIHTYGPEDVQRDAAAIGALRGDPQIRDHLVFQADRLIGDGLSGKGTLAPLLRLSDLEGIQEPTWDAVLQLWQRALGIVRAIPEELF